MTNGGFRSGGKISSAGDGRVIRIINADEQHLQERVLLNLKTTQPFEEVLIDLGQVNFINFYKLNSLVLGAGHIQLKINDDYI